jgi:hypothetical protein
MPNNAPHVAQPWYRQFWPWFLLALPATAVFASLYTVYLAASAPPDLVVDSYAKIGLANERDYTLDRQARQLQAQATMTVGEGPAPELSLQLSIQGPLPKSLLIKLAHPTLAGLDQQVTLLPRGEIYTGVLPMRQARYYVQLEPADGQWRLSGVMYANSTNVVLTPRDDG